MGILVKAKYRGLDVQIKIHRINENNNERIKTLITLSILKFKLLKRRYKNTK
jgi:uncharacterized protein YsxB (DUF464 family)